MRLMLLPLMLVLSLALAACGEDEASSTADDASADARDIAAATRDLQREVVDAGQQVITGLQAGDTAAAVSDATQQRLEDLERGARELADRAQRELPEDERTRDSLRRANEDAAQAAESLQTAWQGNEEEAAAVARDALERVDRRLDRIAAELERRLPQSAQDDLDRLREDVPELRAP